MEFQTQPQNQPNKENLLKIILEVIGGLLILSIFLMLSYFGVKTESQPVPQKQEQTSLQKELPPVTLPKVLYNLAGSIQELQKDSLTFEASIIQLNEANQTTYKTELRKVDVAPTTKISRLTFVSQAGTNQKTPQEAAITFKDLKVKDYIEVICNQDISQAQEFTATQIRVLPH